MTKTKEDKLTLAVLIDPCRQTESYAGCESLYYDLSIVTINPQQQVRNISSTFGELRRFGDFRFQCWVSWYGGQFRASVGEVQYNRVWSVSIREAEFMLKTLKRVQRIQERLVVKPDTFGQFVAMIGNGLGITRCITREGPSTRDHDDNKYRVHPIGELPGLVDYEIEKFRKIKFPEPEVEVA